MLQKLRKCEIRIPIKPLYMPLLAPYSPPEKGRGCIFFSKQSLNIWLHSIRKIYLPKMLQKLRKCENRILIKAPFYPYICPPGPPIPPRAEFFVSNQSLDILLDSIRKICLTLSENVKSNIL